MKKHIFKNVANTLIYSTALIISFGVIGFCGWLVYYCLSEYFSHTCCCDPCKDANYIVAAVTALVGISASVISFVSMIKNTYSKTDERMRLTVEFIQKFKTDVESIYLFLITTQRYNKEKYKYNRDIIKYCKTSDKFELNFSNNSITDEEKTKIFEMFTSEKYLVGWLDYIRKSNYSFILNDKNDNELIFKGKDLTDAESKYLLNKNLANFIDAVRNLCKLLDDTLFSIYKENFDRKVIDEFLKNYFSKISGIATLYVCTNYNNGNNCEYRYLINYLKETKNCVNVQK